jgi:hypothetical protein
MKNSKISLAASLLLLPFITFAASNTAKKMPSSEAKAKLALAKAAQNPLAAMISVPFQNNTNFNIGPDNQTQNVMLVQPVIPFDLNDEWNIISRTIVPIITQPDYITQDGTKTGIGNTQVVAYLSPKKAYKGWIWGVSPVLMLPASNKEYGSKEWGGGVSALALTMPGNWVFGGLVTQIWAPSGDESNQINSTSIQYFVNYNLPDGWYLSTAPTMTYNWQAPSNEKWTVPVGGGGGKIFRWGKQAMNASLRAYTNVVKLTDNSADWTLQAQITFMFPAE